jgi:hypothetical protein
MTPLSCYTGYSYNCKPALPFPIPTYILPILFSRLHRGLYKYLIFLNCPTLVQLKIAVFWVVAPMSRPDDGGSKDLWNVGKLLPDYTVLQPRRQQSAYSPPWEPQILISTVYHSLMSYFIGNNMLFPAKNYSTSPSRNILIRSVKVILLPSTQRMSPISQILPSSFSPSTNLKLC